MRRGLVAAVTVTAAVAATAAASADPPPSFSFTDLPMPAGATTVVFPSVATGAGGTAVVTAAGPTAWRSADDGTSWSAPSTPAATPACGAVLSAPPSAVVGPAADGRQLLLGAMCSDGSLDVFRSGDRGASWSGSAPTDTVLPLTDGGWISSGTGNVVYAVASSEADLTSLLVRRSGDGGQSWGPPSVVNRNLLDHCTPGSVGANGCLARNGTDEGPDIYTPVLVDPTNPRRVYVLWWTIDARGMVVNGGNVLSPWENASKVYVARSDDAGATWSTRLIFDIGESDPQAPGDPNDLANWYPTGAVSRDGTVWFAVARRGPGNTETHLDVLWSTDHGTTWNNATHVDTGLGSTFAPRLAPARNGVALAFYGTSGLDEIDAADDWGVYLDRLSLSNGAGGSALHADQQLVQSDIHRGALCPQGNGSSTFYPQCTDLAHQLVGLDVTDSGTALLSYVDDAHGSPVLRVARQD